MYDNVIRYQKEFINKLELEK